MWRVKARRGVVWVAAMCCVVRRCVAAWRVVLWCVALLCCVVLRCVVVLWCGVWRYGASVLFGCVALRHVGVWCGAMRCDVVWRCVLCVSRNVLSCNLRYHTLLQLVCGVLYVDCVASYWSATGCVVVWCVVTRSVVLR